MISGRLYHHRNKLYGFWLFLNASVMFGTTIEPQDQSPVPVRVQEIALQDYQEYGEFYGTVEGIEEANLLCHAGGNVEDVFVKSGDKVRKGQKLCNIDASLMKVRYDSAVLAESIANKDYQRMSLHRKSGNASDLQVEKARLGWLQAKNQRLEAKKLLDGAHCESPVNGIVTGVNIRKFDHIPPGSLTVNIANISKVRLIVGLPESEADIYTKGRQVKVSMTSRPEKQWSGILDNMALKIDQRNKTFAAEIFVDNHDFSLRPGLTVKARILKFNLKNQVVIPSDAILIRSQEKIVMINDGKKAKSLPVKVLTSYSDQSVIEKGIKSGDQLIIRGQGQVVDGAPIQVISE